MRVPDRFSKFFAPILGCLLIGFNGLAADQGLQVERREDELLLPPYISEYDGGILNVRTEKVTDQKQKRSVKSGEWLEYGDSFTLPPRMNLQVFMNEGMQWVAGAGFDGKIAGGKWNTAKTPYELTVNHGWIRIWAKQVPFSGRLKIITPHRVFSVAEGTFWLMVSHHQSEIYVESGEINFDQGVCESGQYCQGQKISTQWSSKTIEDQIQPLYPNLLKLFRRANEEWQNLKVTEKYAEFRKRGWLKQHRLHPTFAPQK